MMSARPRHPCSLPARLTTAAAARAQRRADGRRRDGRRTSRRAVWALLQIREVRDAVAEAAPMFVSLIAPSRRRSRAAAAAARRRRRASAPPSATDRRAADAGPGAAGAVAATTPPRRAVEPRAVGSRRRRVAVAAPPVPAPPPRAEDHPGIGSPVPRAARARVPARCRSASARPAGCWFASSSTRPAARTNLQVNRSSGHPRLDEAAFAAVQKARFKPYTENGQPVVRLGLHSDRFRTGEMT